MLICWLIGWPCMILGGLIFYYVVKKFSLPHMKFEFESTNEHGVVALQSWEDAIAFKKREAKKEAIETVVGLPAMLMVIVGFLMVGFSTVTYLNQ